MDDHTLDPKPGELRRFEVITGTGRRRDWSAVKARIVTESFVPGVNVSELARRHGLRPQQLFGWRREARGGRLPLPEPQNPAFVPVITDVPSKAAAGRSADEAEACIEIDLRGVVVRLRGRMEVSALAAVLAVVKSVT
jgi:transposase